MIRRLAACGATAIAVVAMSAAPALADDEIGLSRDGITWSTELSAPLFGPDFRFVPGDREVRSFQVRNDGPSDGVLTVDVLATDPDHALADDDFTLEARVGSGPWQPVDAGTTRAATELEVAEGARTRISVRASFDWDSTRQVDTVPFRIHLTLSEDGDVGGVDGGGGDGDGGGEVGGEDDGLPATGATIQPALLWFAAALIGAGIAVLARRDGREEVARRG